MAGALWKKEVVIRQTSTIGVAAAQDWTKNWLASFQDDPANIDGNGDYIDHFFGDLFDARTGNLYRIFSEAAGVKYSMPEVIFDVLITSRFVPWTSVSTTLNFSNDPDMLTTRGVIASYFTQTIASWWNSIKSTVIFWNQVSDEPDLATDEDMIITRGGLSDILDDFVATSSVINDAGLISGNTMTLAHTPAGGIIGGKCNIKIGATNTYDEVECTVNGTTLTVLPDTAGEYDGAVCLVSYLVNS